MKRFLLSFLAFLGSFKVINCSPLNLTNQPCNEYSQSLPKAILVGVKKSGTYAFLRYLEMNPSVRAAMKINGCPNNEVHYFDKDVNYSNGIEWYRNQMPVGKNPECQGNDGIKEVVVEKTPGYFR